MPDDCCPLRRTPFSNLVRMRTCSLVPRPKTTVILKLCIIRWTVFCEMSCEPRRTSAYSEDLRWRMVWQKEVLGLSYKEIGNHLNVDPSTVCRTVHIFHQTGGVSIDNRAKWIGNGNNFTYNPRYGHVMQTTAAGNDMTPTARERQLCLLSASPDVK